MAAANPLPLAFAVKSPGATLAMLTAPPEITPFAFVTIIAPSPSAVPCGTWKLIWAGETKKSGADRDVPAESITLTEAPASVVGSDRFSVAACVDVAKFCPNAATIDSGANFGPRKLAAETGAAVAPGGAAMR